MKIYTKGGDTGTTGLLGGARVSKAHRRIDAYGNVDELNSWLGVVADHSNNAERRAFLQGLQRNLFTIGSMLAADPERPGLRVPHLAPGSVPVLELAIDKMEAALTPLQNFVLPGGHPTASFCHLARTVCRRAERSVVLLAGSEPVDESILTYLNRLSDYLFVLSRMILHEAGGEDLEWHA